MKRYGRVLAYIKPYWIYAALNIFFNLFTIVFSLFTFALLAPFLSLLFGKTELITQKPEFSLSSDALIDYMNYTLSDIIQSQGEHQALLTICFVLLGTFFFRNLGRFMSLFFMAKVRVNAVRDIRDQVFKKILILPLAFFHTRKKGDIMARVTTDVQEVEYSIMNYLDMLIRDPITIIAYFVFLLSMSPSLTLFVIIVLPVTGYIIGRIGRTLRRKSKVGQTKLAGLLSTIEESIGGLRIIKAFNAINFMDQKFLNQNRDYAKVILSIYRRRDLSSPMSEFLSSVVIILVLWFGGGLVLGESSPISGEVFITYMLVFSQIIPPAKTFATGYYSMQKGLASADRIFDILDAEEVIEEKPDAKQIKEFKESIEYNDVTFRYEEENVLKNINLKITKGKVVALVGQSGAGKSTLADLLPRFYDVVEGEILIDGVNIKDYKIDDVRGLMGIVTQESILFNDTVFNNIAFGMQNVTEDEVIEAARIANAHEFIEKMPKGYQTNIGDRGTKLSGGQRQRISIARAVLQNPPILIMDEATSALDTESERLVQDALANVMSNRTSLVIAHRLSTIKSADEIVVMYKGEIRERGNHNELIALDGIYKKLHELQTFA
ncbi:MAG: ABC transporter ATP-binding protein [Bacteroidales bacterium]|jgi:subfamily B ATP-binding cassette protein MsbA|nr:ABC transporter ATP-binding protein [Bacteroidales bacterium]